MANTQNLSPGAQSIVINLATSRQGVTPKGRNPVAALAELQRAGVLGEDYGLTRAGCLYRDRLLAARMDAAFS
jgi:hypothetical protein